MQNGEAFFGESHIDCVPGTETKSFSPKGFQMVPGTLSRILSKLRIKVCVCLDDTKVRQLFLLPGG